MQFPGIITAHSPKQHGLCASARILILLLVSCVCSTASCAAPSSDPWQLVFSDDGTASWQDKWFVEGDLASIKNTTSGIVFSSGPTPLDQASHAVLWTNDSFSGDIKIEYDYTRLDKMTEATSVNILYIQATGTGNEVQPMDISQSRHLRRVPWMKSYFLNMNLIHVSYATTGPDRSHYVAARQYPAATRESFAASTLIKPVYENVSIFAPGDTYHIIAIKQGKNLKFIAERDGKREVFKWDLSEFPNITEGRVGFRHMWARSSRYQNIKIYTKEPAK